MTTRFRRLVLTGALAVSAVSVVGTHATAGRDTAGDVAAYWTPERIASAQPRDLVVDGRGLGYLRGRDGSLTPYGHSVRARLVQEPTAAPTSPMAKPGGGGGGDTTGPIITNWSPAAGDTVGGSVTFTATVTDESGVRSVNFVIGYPDGRTQSFAANASGDVWSTTLSGFSDGDWSWTIEAKDAAGRGGNSSSEGPIRFTVATNGGGGGTGGGGGADIVTNSQWSGGDVQMAAGRILFQMPQLRGKRITGWATYVCSGTTVTDSKTGQSIVLTAAHCVYDDVAKAFARNVLFIPNQAGTTGAGTDTDCSNDPIGCFVPSHGVVDVNWTTRTFPDNVEWDYAYYVVPTDGSSQGLGNLDDRVSALTIGFSAAVAGNVTHALGYSYSDDPNFMYCAEPMSTTGTVNWWLPSCELSGGASGGPWVQPMDGDTGRGPIISVNSWGYTTGPGMAGPFLDASAKCVYDEADTGTTTPTDQGVTDGGLGVVKSGCGD